MDSVYSLLILLHLPSRKTTYFYLYISIGIDMDIFPLPLPPWCFFMTFIIMGQSELGLVNTTAYGHLSKSAVSSTSISSART